MSPHFSVGILKRSLCRKERPVPSQQKAEVLHQQDWHLQLPRKLQLVLGALSIRSFTRPLNCPEALFLKVLGENVNQKHLKRLGCRSSLLQDASLPTLLEPPGDASISAANASTMAEAS